MVAILRDISLIRDYGTFATRFMEVYHNQKGYIRNALIALANGGAGRNMTWAAYWNRGIEVFRDQLAMLNHIGSYKNWEESAGDI